MATHPLVRRLSSATLLVALAHFILEVCNNFLPVIYPRLIATLGLSYSQIGILALTGSICGALTQPLFGHLSDRWNPQLIVVLSLAWIGSLMGLVGFVSQYWVLVFLVGMGALGSAAFHPAGVSLATAVTSRRPGAALSIFSVGGNLGSAMSPIIVGWGLVILGLRGTAVLIPIGLLIGLLVHLRLAGVPLINRLPRPAVNSLDLPRQATGPGRAWVALALVVVFVAARSWFQGSLMTYLPEWLHSQGRPLEATGPILALMLVGVGAGSLVGGTLADRIGGVPIVLVSLGLLGPVQWLFLQSEGMIQIVSVALIGILIGATFPVGILMAQQTLPHAVGLASSMVIGIGWLPAGIGAWVVGWLADRSTLADGLTTLIFVPVLGVIAALAFALMIRTRLLTAG